MTKYNLTLQEIFNTTPQPAGLVVDVIEYPHYLALVVYEDNLEEMSVDKKQQCSQYLTRLRNLMRLAGGRVEVEARKGKPHAMH